MADYIERYAQDGRRVRFPKDLPRAKQDEFLANYGKDTGGRAESQDKSLEDLIKMSNLPEQAKMNAPTQANDTPNQDQQGNYYQQPQEGQQKPDPWSDEARKRYSQRAQEYGQLTGRYIPQTPEQTQRIGENVFPTIGAAASFAPGLAHAIKGAGWGLKTLGNMGTQGLTGILGDPEHAGEAFTTGAGITGAMESIMKGLTSNNKAARFVKDRMAPAAVAYGSYEAARAAGLSVPEALAASAAAYQTGKRFINPKLNKNYNARKYAEQLGPMSEEALAAHKKGKEYGVHITPAQASKKAGDIAAESRLGTSTQGAELKQTHAAEQRRAKEAAVSNLNKKIYDKEKHDPIKEKFYEMVSKAEVPKEYLDKIYDKIKKTFRPGRVTEVKMPNPENAYGKAKVRAYPSVSTEHKSKNIIDSISETARKKGIPMTKDVNMQKAINEALDDATVQNELKGIPDSQLYKNGKFMNLVRQKMTNAYEHYASIPGGGTKANAIKESIDKITPILDAAIPGFSQARGLYERKMVVKKIMDLTKKGQPHGETLAKYLNNSENKKALLHNMRNVKGADKHINDLHDIFKRTENVTDKELANAISDSFSHSQGGSKFSLARDLMHKLKGGDFDKAAIELTQDPNWPARLESLKKISNTSKYLAKFVELVSKPSSAAGKLSISNILKESEKD